MILEIFLKGLIIGAIAGFPLGPIGFLCVKKSLIQKNTGGYYVGLGSSIADMLFAIIALLGIGFVYGFLEKNEIIIRLLIGAILFIWGFRELGNNLLIGKQFKVKRKKASKEILNGFLLALTNPFVIFMLLMLYATLDLSKITSHLFLSVLLIISTFLGTFFSVTLVNWFLTKNNHRITDKLLSRVNNILAWVLILFGSLIIGIYL